MRKELLVAICAGTLLGVLAAFGIWKANKNLQAEGISVTPFVPSVSDEPSQTPVPTPFLSGQIIPLSPIDTEVVTQGQIPVTGKTMPNMWVSISGEDEDVLLMAKPDGLFQQPISLVSGINQLVLTTFDTTNASQEARVTVTYSNIFPVQGTDKPKAYIGIITDKTESSLQIKDMKGSLLLLSLDPKLVSVVKITDTTQKDALYSDLAIGDSIAALGYVGGSNVLDTKRILLTTPKTVTRKAFMGVISDATKKQITFKVSDGALYTIDSTKTISVTQGNSQDKILFSDLEVGQTIIATGTLSGSSLVGRRIQVVE